MSGPLHRVRVVGTSGAGKTTLARRLARAIDAPHIELDEVFWGPGWVKRGGDDARADLRARTAGPRWVADGNWDSQLDGLLADADTVVWLDHPRGTVMSRVVRRTVWRGLTRRRLWHGNRESLANLRSRDPHRNIVLWAWHHHPVVVERYAARSAAPGSDVVRLRGPRAAERWLRAVERRAGGG